MRSRFQLVLSSAIVNYFLVRFLLIDCDCVHLKPFDVSKRQLIFKMFASPFGSTLLTMSCPSIYNFLLQLGSLLHSSISLCDPHLMQRYLLVVAHHSA